MKRYIAIICALLVSAPAQAAWTFINAGQSYSTNSNGYQNGAANSGGFTTLNLTGADFVVACIAEAGNATTTPPTFADTSGNTWNFLTTRTQNSHAGTIAYAFNATVSGTMKFTVGGTANFPAFTVAGYASGAQSGTPFDLQNGATALFQLTLATGSITPSVANELVVTCLTRDQETNVPTINGGFTLRANVIDAGFGHPLSAVADLIQTTATAANPTWTTAGSNSSIVAAIASFKSAGAGPTVLIVPPMRARRGAGP